MEPLEIKDSYNDNLFVSCPYDIDIGMPACVLSIKDTLSDELQFEIKKPQALQIIAHLKQCFNI